MDLPVEVLVGWPDIIFSGLFPVFIEYAKMNCLDDEESFVDELRRF